ncbi:MAG: helix-turn-helix transcriptional regulator [Planctomycetota bacterium]|jgi:excisionase family DNA binding protein
MSKRGRHGEIVPLDDIRRAFDRPPWDKYGPIITPEQLAEITGRSRSTVYQWIQQGRMAGSLRRRGKGYLLWRDKAIHVLFNAPAWEPDGEKDHA